MYNIIFRTNTNTNIDFGGGNGLGLCSFTEECPEPVKLINVNGTITITDNKNKLTLNIVNDVISIPILIDEDVTGRANITIQEVNKQSDQKPLSNSFSFGGFSTQPNTLFGNSCTNPLLGTSNPTPKEVKKPTTRFYQLSIGKLFKTKFFVRNNEFHYMAKEMEGEGMNVREFNVIEINISFKTESGLQLISNSPK